MEEKSSEKKPKYFFNKSIALNDPNKLGEELFEISRKFNLPYSGLSKLAVSYAKQGLDIEEIVKRIKIDVCKV